MPERADQKAPDGWSFARQRDFTGGESLAKLPEMVARNQMIRMANAIISPEGLVTECWQMDKALFVNVSGGIVVTPIPGSTLFTVYAASGNDVVSFIFDPASPAAYDLSDASGYPGYVAHDHANPVTITGISHGTPFLGKNYCCAATSLYLVGVLTVAPEAIAFGAVQVLTANRLELTVTNTTEEVMTLTGVTLSGTDSSAIGHTGAFPQTLDPDETYSFDVTYNPAVPGESAATLNISNTLGILQVDVTGTAETMISASTANHDFGAVHKDHFKSFVLQVENAGPRAVSVTGVAASGNDPDNFTTSLAAPATIEPGGTLDIEVTFTPGGIGAFSADLTVLADVGDIEGIALSGTGANLLTVAPTSAVLYNNSVQVWTHAGTFNLHNASTTDSVTISSVITGSDQLAVEGVPVHLGPGESAALTVDYYYPYRGFLSSTTMRIVSDWGTLYVPLTLWGVR